MDKLVSKKLKSDLALTLNENPGLELKYSGSMPVRIQGRYDLVDDEGKLLESFNISVSIPQNYPNGFPTLTELSTKIPRHIDRHINDKGEACVELTQNAILVARNGISIYAFFKNYVHKYFCWQLLYDFDKTDLQEWPHDEKAILEFYCKLLKTDDVHCVRRIMRIAIERKWPSRNSSCVCGKNKKYKRCHISSYPSLRALGVAVLERDFLLLSKFTEE